MADIPHFAYPFRFVSDQSGVHAEVKEQDTLDEIADSATVVMLTPLGWRDELPDFGAPDFAFKKVPLGEDVIEGIIEDQEPRALFAVKEQLGSYDYLIDYINVELNARGGSLT